MLEKISGEGADGYKRALDILPSGAERVIERIERLAAIAREEDLDMIVVADLVRPGDSENPDPNVRWLSGFSGTSGAALVGPDSATFVTDFRYIERVRDELVGFEISQAERQLMPAVAELLEAASASTTRTRA